MDQEFLDSIIGMNVKDANKESRIKGIYKSNWSQEACLLDKPKNKLAMVVDKQNRVVEAFLNEMKSPRES